MYRLSRNNYSVIHYILQFGDTLNTISYFLLLINEFTNYRCDLVDFEGQ